MFCFRSTLVITSSIWSLRSTSARTLRTSAHLIGNRVLLKTLSVVFESVKELAFEVNTRLIADFYEIDKAVGQLRSQVPSSIFILKISTNHLLGNIGAFTDLSY